MNRESNQDSPEDQLRRKQQMFEDLQVQFHAFHRRRRLSRRILAGSACAAALVISLAWFSTGGGSNPGAPEALSNSSARESEKSLAGLKNDRSEFESKTLLTKIVESSPTAVERFSIDNSMLIERKLKFESLNDKEVLKMLAESGQPSILGKINGELTVFPLKEF